MLELTKVFDSAILPIEIINEKEFMVDVSGIASKYGKNITDWRDSKRMTQVISKLGALGFSKASLIQSENGSGTKIHNKLLISFARFISVDFEMWCDDTIYEIMTESRDKEIIRLKAQKKLCNVYDDKFTSARGLVQHTSISYNETEIKDFMHSMGMVQPEHKVTRFWKPTKKGFDSGMVKADKMGTPIYDMDKIIPYMDSMKSLLENMKPIDIN